MIEIVIGTILVLLGPVVEGFIYGIFNIFMFPLVAQLLLRFYSFKVSIIVIVLVSLALDSLLHIRLGSILMSFTGMLLFDSVIGIVLPKDNPVLLFITNFLNFFLFNLLLVIFRAWSLGENLSADLRFEMITPVIVSSIILSILFIVALNTSQLLHAKDRSHMIRLR